MSNSSPSLDEGAVKLWILVESEGIAAAAALFFHGIFVLLFILALRYLWTPGPGHTLYRIVACLLALFAVVQVALDVSLVYMIATALTDRVATGQTPRTLMNIYDTFYKVRQVTLAVNNFVADGLFLYRLKLIWGTHRLARLVVGIVLILIAATAAVAGLSITYTWNIRIPFGTALGTNVVLLLFTAGRIWVKGYRAAPRMGSRMRAKWHAAVAIIAESSLLYVAGNTLYMLSMTKDVPPFTAFQNICWGALAQVVNIIPMMVIVRVALAKDGNSPPSAHLAAEAGKIPIRAESDADSELTITLGRTTEKGKQWV